MFATETWERRERGPRPRLVVTDVASVMYGCQVGAMLSRHVSRVTRLSRSSWRDCRHQTEICITPPSPALPSLQRGQIITKWHAAMVGGENDMTWKMAIISLLTTILSKKLLSIFMCLCLYFLPRLFLAQGDTEPCFSLIHVSLMSPAHMLQCCRHKDITRQTPDGDQNTIKQPHSEMSAAEVRVMVNTCSDAKGALAEWFAGKGQVIQHGATHFNLYLLYGIPFCNTIFSS